MPLPDRRSTETGNRSRPDGRTSERPPGIHFLIGLARAFGGALIFALPMLMTMEMWWLGFYMDRMRLALLLGVTFPLLVGLSHYIGFKETFDWREDVVDALVAYAVGFSASAIVLFLLAVIERGMAADEMIGKVALQAVPAAIGALLAFSQLGGSEDRQSVGQKEARRLRYHRELFLMLLGALFLAFNVAPTEEMIRIAYKMTAWHTAALAGVSLLIMHAFNYSLEFHGQEVVPPGTPHWSLFLRFTVVGYAIALLTSLFVLWTFGRLDGTGNQQMIMVVMVLAFPAAVGAAAARLIL